jgi:transposase
MLPHMLNQIPRDQHIGSMTADGAYDMRRCHNAIADRGANAVIPPRRNAQPWKPTTAGSIARNVALRAPRSGSLTLWQ